MTIVMKEYNLTGKVAGSTDLNKAVAYIDGVEFTQEQYDNIVGSELVLPNTPSPNLKFEFPYIESRIQFISILFTSKVGNGIVSCRSGDYGVFNESKEYAQRLLSIYGNPDEGTMTFEIKSTDTLNIYGVKINVYYDDSSLRKYSGYISTGDDVSNNRSWYSDKTKDEVIGLLQAVTEDNISDFTGTWTPVAGEIIP